MGQKGQKIGCAANLGIWLPRTRSHHCTAAPGWAFFTHKSTSLWPIVQLQSHMICSIMKHPTPHPLCRMQWMKHGSRQRLAMSVRTLGPWWLNKDNILEYVSTLHHVSKQPHTITGRWWKPNFWRVWERRGWGRGRPQWARIHCSTRPWAHAQVSSCAASGNCHSIAEALSCSWDNTKPSKCAHRWDDFYCHKVNMSNFPWTYIIEYWHTVY